MSDVQMLQNGNFNSGFRFIFSASGLCRGGGKAASQADGRSGAVAGVIANTIRALRRFIPLA
jgi:hypothetical protein